MAKTDRLPIVMLSWCHSTMAFTPQRPPASSPKCTHKVDTASEKHVLKREIHHGPDFNCEAICSPSYRIMISLMQEPNPGDEDL
ncbi:hypothetical protein NMY22_g8211 [Coprinellus aureogranulatus]|nr:hypothetical protein NMY22_g8211 [Coprinellus aureogranulatus]